MKNKKRTQLFAFANRIILTDGSSLWMYSVRYSKNYHLDFTITNETNLKKKAQMKNTLHFRKKNRLY